tara:strand:+ start:107 stop:1480 length:1374 start_codon:yes stop_codon:yes gene_type:complete
MLKNIFIGSINRSGGSLLARLFDGHSQIVSYPLELPFPHNNAFYKISDNFAGIPMSVPLYDNNNLKTEFNFLYPGNYSRSLTPDLGDKALKFNKYDLLDIPKNKPKIEVRWGKEKSDIIGVRKNYLEKSFYENVETNFDYEHFIKRLHEHSNQNSSWPETHNAKHLAFFESWDKGKYLTDKTSHVVYHDSGGLYLTNISDFFKTYNDSRFIVPVRDILGYVASEKIRLARIFFGSRRFNNPVLPFFLIKKFKSYDLKAKIRNWQTSITRIHLLQKEFGKNKNFISYSNENLVLNTSKVMKSFAKNLNIEFENLLNEPTIGGRPWGGNSHYGISKGINSRTLDNYKKVLDSEEIDFIKNKVGHLREEILSQKTEFLDLSSVKERYLNDLYYQKKYFYDKEKISMYYSLVNYGGRKINVSKVNKLSILALLFSAYVYIYNLPRRIKLKFFPGKGKQNYT